MGLTFWLCRELLCSIEPENEASLAVAGKLGFRARAGLHARGPLTVQVLELRRDDFLSK